MKQLFFTAAFLGMLPVPEAAAVWAHRPLCETEHDSVNAKKESLEKCIGQVELRVQDGDAKTKDQVKQEAPCEAELNGLVEAGKEMNRCMEKQIWWVPKK
jgi:hypothetical protein